MCLTLEEFILTGGNHGSRENRVALNRTKEGGKIGYIFSRIFVGYDRLCRYYPILEKHKWLMPFMQVRRWFKLLKPRVREMAKDEISANTSVESSKADKLNSFLKEIGL